MDIKDLMTNKADVIKFLLETIESNNKAAEGVRKIANSDNPEDNLDKALKVVANQSVQIKKLSMLLLMYVSGGSFETDVAKTMNKMGRGEEAMRQMFKNKMNGL